jgi:hypothetical protein
VEDLLKIGYYAFTDYAACYWTSHLRAGIACGASEQCTGKLISHLQRFIDSHYRPCDEDTQIPEPTRSLLSCLQEFEGDGFESFLKAFVATERQVDTYGEGAASNNALDIMDIIARIRANFEDGARRESWDEVDQQLFPFFYGEAIYKCPRVSCSYFCRGFTSATKRDAHIRKHTPTLFLHLPRLSEASAWLLLAKRVKETYLSNPRNCTIQTTDISNKAEKSRPTMPHVQTKFH